MKQEMYSTLNRPSTPILLNDRHLGLNHTLVRKVFKVSNLEDLQRTIEWAAYNDCPISVAGGKFAMGGQQFGTDTLFLDTSHLNQILNFDQESGHIEIEAGIRWDTLIPQYLKLQDGRTQQWGIAQKQTGADLFSLGGALSVNIHGGGLRMSPFIQDIESFRIVDSYGCVRTCSRTQHTDLFRLAIGGFGLFGLLYSITLRLRPRNKLKRLVELVDVDALIPTLEHHIQDGCQYGDFQFAIDPASPDFLQNGILTIYRPVDPATPIPPQQPNLSESDWRKLSYLAHTEKSKAFNTFVAHGLAMHRTIWWSDTHQLSNYPCGYHHILDHKLRARVSGSEIITELFLPRNELVAFLGEVKEDFRTHQVNLIYGTIRLTEPDRESFLAWAGGHWACIVFNLHLDHTEEGIYHTQRACRRLIDFVKNRGGRFYLPYHKWATQEQLETCYPQFPDFLRYKLAYDPEERFQSDWYRHFTTMYRDQIPREEQSDVDFPKIFFSEAL